MPACATGTAGSLANRNAARLHSTRDPTTSCAATTSAAHLSGRSGPLGRERPLLECGAPAVGCEPDHPQITELLLDRISVPDLHPHHRRVPLDRDDLAGHAEHLGGPGTLGFPPRSEERG